MLLAIYLLCFNVMLYIKNKNYIVVLFNNENFKRFAILIQILYISISPCTVHRLMNSADLSHVDHGKYPFIPPWISIYSHYPIQPEPLSHTS